MRIAKFLVTGALLAMVVAGPPGAAWAQRPSAQAQVGLVRTGAGTFTIDVENADLQTIVRAISEFSGQNILMGKDVHGHVSVNLRNVGWAEALRTVLRSQGYDYVQEGGVLRVDDEAKLRNEEVERQTAVAKAMELVPLETRIVKVNYANATELQRSLQSSLSKRGHIEVDARTNSLIVTDLTSVSERIEKMAMDL